MEGLIRSVKRILIDGGEVIDGHSSVDRSLVKGEPCPSLFFDAVAGVAH